MDETFKTFDQDGDMSLSFEEAKELFKEHFSSFAKVSKNPSYRAKKELYEGHSISDE